MPVSVMFVFLCVVRNIPLLLLRALRSPSFRLGIVVII